MSRGARLILWLYIAFNLLTAVTLVAAPEVVDGPYLGGELTPTRRFQWYSVAGLHVLMIAVIGVAMGLPRAADRRKLVGLNAAFYLLWDAGSQWAYWGAAIGMAPADLHTNAGVSTIIGLALVGVAWRDRDGYTSEASAGTVRAR